MDWVALGELLTLLAIGLLTPGPNALTCFGHSGLFGPKANIKLKRFGALRQTHYFIQTLLRQLAWRHGDCRFIAHDASPP